MSFLNVATPAITIANVVRPLIELGFLATIVMVFEPLLKGLLQAGLLLLKPRQSFEERKAGTTLRSMLTVNRMASNFEDSDPDFSAELRALASRS